MSKLFEQMKPIHFLFFLLTFWACSNDDKTDLASSAELPKVEIEPQKVNLFSTMDHLRVRDAPDLGGETIYMLSDNEKMEYLEVKLDGDFEKVKLRGFTYKDPWIKVKMLDGSEGWVYGGGVKFEKGSEIADILTKARLESLFGKKFAKSILRYNQNFERASTSKAFAEVFRYGKSLRDSTENILHEKIEVTDYKKLPDLSWLEDALPGYHSQLVAEGTMFHLFADFKDWAKKARRTAGHEDDQFVELCFDIFPIDSIEHFYPAWFMQTWDYGGHSELGTGIHNNLLEVMNVVLANSSLFEEEIEDFKSKLLHDITDSHVTYWQPKDVILKELDEIIASDYGILNEEDKIALKTRIKLFENPEANGIKVDFKSGKNDL